MPGIPGLQGRLQAASQRLLEVLPVRPRRLGGEAVRPGNRLQPERGCLRLALQCAGMRWVRQDDENDQEADNEATDDGETD